MRCPSYLTKKQDIYYFRQACPKAVKEKIGKREIIKSLGVREKSTAVRIAREFKVTFDNLIDYLLVQDDCGINPMDYLNDQLHTIRSKYENNSSAVLSFPVSNYIYPQPVCESSLNQPAKASPESPKADKPKTDIEPLIDKFKAEKIRLKRWTNKTLKETDGHFDLLLSILKHIKNM